MKISKPVGWALKWGIAALLLGYIFWQVEDADLASILASAELLPYLLSLVVTLFGPVANAWKYQFFLKANGQPLSLAEMTRINYETRFYSVALPGGVGQAALRWHKLKSMGSAGEQIAFYTIFERLVFIGSVGVIGFGALTLEGMIPPQTGWGLAILGGVGLLVLLWVCLKGNSPAQDHPPMQSRLKRYLLGWRHAQLGLGVFSSTLFSSILLIVLFWIRFHLVVMALGYDPTFTFSLLGGSATVVSMMIPITIEGLGIRESVLGILFESAGSGMVTGVVVGLMIFSQVMLVALVGGVLNLTKRK